MVAIAPYLLQFARYTNTLEVLLVTSVSLLALLARHDRQCFVLSVMGSVVVVVGRSVVVFGVLVPG